MLLMSDVVDWNFMDTYSQSEVRFLVSVELFSFWPWTTVNNHFDATKTGFVLFIILIKNSDFQDKNASDLAFCKPSQIPNLISLYLQSKVWVTLGLADRAFDIG